MRSFLIIAGFLCTFLANINAQATSSNVWDAQAKSDAATLTTKYDLNESQAEKMYKIQARKQRNLSEIETLKTSDPAKYFIKLKNIQKGTLGSIQRMLTGTKQKEAFQKTQVEIRGKKASKRKELLSKGISTIEIERQLLDIYAE